eukprot:m.33457 g.33457  ORF g.33457 m.33457 type:complete len:460 (+) comp16824_c0_seq2:144-1523(+)
MLVVIIVSLLVAAFPSSAVCENRGNEHWDSSDLETQLQHILDSKAQLWNSSFSVGVRKGSTTMSVAAGIEDFKTSKKLTKDSHIPLGSATKPWTAIGILQLIEAKTFDLDDLAAPLLDPALKAWNGTTMFELFGGNKDVLLITVRHLLGMRSGLQDYDDDFLEKFSFTYPNIDYKPFDYIHHFNKTLLCHPSQCGSYSSVGYIFLGLMLAWHNNASHWSDFDQFSVIPQDVVNDYKGQVTFPIFGECSTYPDIIHQYAYYVADGDPSISFFDIDDASCLNGWTCGNLAATSGAVASFFYDLFHNKLVSSGMVSEMLKFQPFTVGWGINSTYGLGLFQENYFPVVDSGKFPNELTMVGHGGMDYGSGGSPLGYNQHFDFGLSVTMGTAVGQNCSLKNIGDNGNAWQDATCAVYDAVIQSMSNGTFARLNCTWQAAQATDFGGDLTGCQFTNPFANGNTLL